MRIYAGKRNNRTLMKTPREWRINGRAIKMAIHQLAWGHQSLCNFREAGQQLWATFFGGGSVNGLWRWAWSDLPLGKVL